MAIKLKDDRIGNKKSYTWIWLLVLAFVVAVYWFYGDYIWAYVIYYYRMYHH